MNISKIIDQVINDVSLETANGMVDLDDALHVYMVQEKLKQFIDPTLVEKVLYEKKTEIPDDQMITYKEKDADGKMQSKEMKAVSAKGMEKEHPAKIEYDKLAGEEDDSETAGKEDDSTIKPSNPMFTGGEPGVTLDFSKNQKYNNKISDDLQGEAEYIEFESDADKPAFLEAAKKLGDDPNSLTKDDIDVINKYARISDGAGFKLYTAREPDNFGRGRGKIVFASGSKSKVARDYLEKLKALGIKTAPATTVKGSKEASKFSAKDLSAGKINGEKAISTESVTSKKDKAGNVVSVTVGSMTLEKTVITNDMDDRELKTAERRNRFIDKVAKQKTLEFVETIKGVDEGTEDGRKVVCNQYPKKIAKFITDSLGADIKPEEQEIIDQLDALGDIEDPAEYEVAALKVINDMDQVPTIRKGAADLTESIVYLILNKRGIPTKLPAGETFKVSDLMSFVNPKDFGKINIASESIVMITKSGGVSVKMKGGAPSGAEEKIYQSEFKNEETQGMLLQLVSNHNAWHSTGGGISSDDMDDAESQNEAIEAWARENKMLGDDEIRTRDGRTPEEWAEDTLALWESKGKVRGLTPDERKLYKRGLAGHVKGCIMLEKIYNSDIDSQEFGNANLKTYKSKPAELEMSDGINSVSLMKCAANPGWKFTKDHKPAQPTSVYAGNLVHAEYDKKTGKFKS